MKKAADWSLPKNSRPKTGFYGGVTFNKRYAPLFFAPLGSKGEFSICFYTMDMVGLCVYNGLVKMVFFFLGGALSIGSMLLVACGHEAAESAPAVAETVPVNAAKTTQLTQAVKDAIGRDDLVGFIRALAEQEPTEELLLSAVNDSAANIVDWLCDKKGMRLSRIERGRWSGSIVPCPDSADDLSDEDAAMLDDEAYEALLLLFKAYPGAAENESFMVTTIGHYCKYRYKKSLRYVLSKGANPNGADEQGRTPLDFAYYYKWSEGKDILCAKGGKAHTPGRTVTEKAKLFESHVCSNGK